MVELVQISIYAGWSSGNFLCRDLYYQHSPLRKCLPIPRRSINFISCLRSSVFVNMSAVLSFNHWRNAKIFWDTKVTEYVETMPYFVIIFWGKKLTKISLFKDISWNQKNEEIHFFPMILLAKKLAETIQLFFHCYHHTPEENTAFGMIFWYNKWNRKLSIPHIF